MAGLDFHSPSKLSSVGFEKSLNFECPVSPSENANIIALGIETPKEFGFRC